MKQKPSIPVSGPLMCWDIFMDGYHRTLQRLDSLQKLKLMARQLDWKVQWDIEDHLLAKQKIVLVTDPAFIIRFASANITEMNGYKPEEVLGQSPKMFQGKDTQPEIRSEIREAIIKRIPFSGTILNYRKDGTTYNCHVEEYPVWSKKGALVNFIAFEKIA